MQQRILTAIILYQSEVYWNIVETVFHSQAYYQVCSHFGYDSTATVSNINSESYSVIKPPVHSKG